MLGASLQGSKARLLILQEKHLYYILAFKILTTKMLLLQSSKENTCFNTIS